MERNQANLLQGTLGLLILKAIGDAEFHGLGIARRVEAIPEGTFKVSPGSLFPALHAWKKPDGRSPSGASRKATAAPGFTGAQKLASVSSESKPNKGRPSPAPSAAR